MAKTIREQIAAAQASIATLNAKVVELTAKLGDEVDYSKVLPGAVVSFNYGKGQTVRVLKGQVIGIKPADPAQPKSSPLIAIAVGEGFDAMIAKVYHTAVTKIETEAPTPPAV